MKRLTILLIAVFVTACGPKAPTTDFFVIPKYCLGNTSQMLQDWMTVNTDQVSYKLHDIKATPFHLQGMQILEFTTSNLQLIDALVAKLNAQFSQCDANKGVYKYDLHQVPYEAAMDQVRDGMKGKKAVIHLNPDSIHAYYHDEGINP